MLAVSVSKNLMMMVIIMVIIMVIMVVIMLNMIIMMTKYLDPLTTRAARRLGKMYLKHLETIFTITINTTIITTMISTITMITMIITSTCCCPSESLCNGGADKPPGIAQLPRR